MYGDPALPQDFVSLPYVNANAPKGGTIVFGNTGAFDSLNPFVQKGSPPWQWRFWGYESLMARSWDEPFTLYGLLAESIQTGPDRQWVEFTLREEARFWDGTPVTVDDVIWSYEVLGTQGHLRYRTLWSQIDTIEQTGPRSVKISFSTDNRELALIAGMRPILQKAQWEGKRFEESALPDVPIGSGPYRVQSFEPMRGVTLTRNPDYWAKDLPVRKGMMNFDTIEIEYYGDQTVLFEAFKAGEISAIREFNAERWNSQYGFPAVARGDVVLSEIPHQKPSGITGLVMNTRRAPFDDWRVREALILAFNFEFINDTLTGGAQPRISSYFSNSHLAMQDGPAQGKVLDLLSPHADTLLPGTIEGYALPAGDGSARNRKNLRRAMALLQEAGFSVQNEKLSGPDGRPFQIHVLLRQSASEMKSIVEIYSQALARLGIDVQVDLVDSAQFTARESEFDFDMTTIRRDLSLSPGNEQRLYWGRQGVDQPGSRNLMGMASPAAEAMIAAMLSAQSPEDFTAAVRALDRVLTAGRYVVPIWQYDIGRIAHIRQMKYTDTLPVYGDRGGFMPEVWWYEAD
jgi:peptide/nickel transport system substrate-binding protein